MIWKYCDRTGKITEKDLNGYQIDEVGNILQSTGALKTKACQNCQQEFLIKTVRDEIRQDIDNFKCKKCEFESATPQGGLKHILDKTTHKLEIEPKSRVVGYRNTLEDNPIITKLKDDYIILCKKCNDLN